MSDAPATPDAGDNEIERLRERVTFYESFDRLIQENIARSGDLLRQAVEMRESAEREMARARADATRELTIARERYRQTLAGLLGEVTRLQQQVARLEQRLSESLDTLDGEHPAEPAAPLVAPPVPVPVPATAPEAFKKDQASPPTPAATATIVAPEPIEAASETAPAEAEAEPEPEPAAAEETAEAPPSVEAPAAEPESGPRAVTVLVHGVPRAATALSLQRHLARLEPVEGVEAREYAEGILRLQVMTHRPLRPDDLGGWEGGAGLTPLNVLDDVLEVRLPRTEGL